jgi:hypothetical protein
MSKHSHFGDQYDAGLDDILRTTGTPAAEPADENALTPDEYAEAMGVIDYAEANWFDLTDEQRAMAEEVALMLDASDAYDDAVDRVVGTLDDLEARGHSNGMELVDHYTNAGLGVDDALAHAEAAAEYIGPDHETNRDLDSAISAFMRERHVLGHGGDESQ